MTKGEKFHYMVFGGLFPTLAIDLHYGHYGWAAVAAAAIALNFAIEFIPSHKSA